jgi:hypothetical protein
MAASSPPTAEDDPNNSSNNIDKKYKKVQGPSEIRHQTSTTQA